MNDIFNIIAEIIHSKFFCPLQNGRLILQDSTSKPVEIKKTGKVICLELDKAGVNAFPFFNNHKPGLCSIVDRVIFCSKDDSLFVFIIELKTNALNVTPQINAGYELIKFICGTVVRMLKYKTVDIQYRGIIFTNRGIKGTTKPKNLQYEEHPQSGLKYKYIKSGSSIELDALTF